MFFKLLLVLLALFAWTPASADQVCDTCDATRPIPLCEDHRQVEEETFRSQKVGLASVIEVKRLAALEAIAALSAAHINAPSQRVAQELVRQLEAKSPAVRLRAAELLGSGQHPASALAGLLDALQRVDGAIKTDIKEGLAVQKRLEHLGKGIADSNDTINELTELADLEKELAALTEQINQNGEVRAAVSSGLGHLPDERATSALLLSLKQEPDFSAASPAVCEALLQHGTGDAVRGVIGSLRQKEKDLVEIVKSRDKIKKEKNSSRPPKSWRGGKELWMSTQERQRARRLAYAQGHVDLLQGRVSQTLDALTSFGVNHGLSKAPKPSARFASAWGRWIAKNIKALPESVGSIAGP